MSTAPAASPGDIEGLLPGGGRGVDPELGSDIVELGMYPRMLDAAAAALDAS